MASGQGAASDTPGWCSAGEAVITGQQEQYCAEGNWSVWFEEDPTDGPTQEAIQKCLATGQRKPPKNDPKRLLVFDEANLLVEHWQHRGHYQQCDAQRLVAVVSQAQRSEYREHRAVLLLPSPVAKKSAAKYCYTICRKAQKMLENACIVVQRAGAPEEPPAKKQRFV